jgi:hypothetical protein
MHPYITLARILCRKQHKICVVIRSSTRSRTSNFLISTPNEYKAKKDVKLLLLLDSFSFCFTLDTNNNHRQYDEIMQSKSIEMATRHKWGKYKDKCNAWSLCCFVKQWEHRFHDCRFDFSVRWTGFFFSEHWLVANCNRCYNKFCAGDVVVYVKRISLQSGKNIIWISFINLRRKLWFT